MCFEGKEKYINDVDWTKNDVVLNTFFLGPLGMTQKTKKQNLSMQKQLSEMRLEFEATKRALEIREYAVEQDKKICELYMRCINTITSIIQEVILPELELIETFFHAVAIKNAIVAECTMREESAKMNIALLKDTPYHQHYIFVKNAFLLYVMSCKIYDTPVLTRLLTNSVEVEDQKLMETHENMLALQADALRKSAMNGL